jgi:hypothetical protein
MRGLIRRVRQRRDPKVFLAVFRLAGRLETSAAQGLFHSPFMTGGAGGFPKRLPRSRIMCRSIKTLFNFDPPATDDEVRAAALQFVRKLSGFNTPSKVNEAAFGDAVEEVFEVARRLINRLETSASARNREEEAEKARQRAAERFGRPASA